MIEDIKKVLEERMKIGEDSIGQNDDLLILMLDDLDKTMNFITTCTDQEFYYMSDTFDIISRMKQSRSFVECLKTRFINISDLSIDLYYLNDEIVAAEYELPIEEF